MRFNPAAVEARGSYQDTYAAFGPPRSGKSNWMALVGLGAPGACMFTSTRADLARDTAKARTRRGPVYFINPGGDGGFPSNLRWSPVTGCQDPRVAMRAAGAIIHAAPRDPSGKDAWWDHQSKTLLQLLLHAAALIPGATIWDVRRWASGVDLHQDDVVFRALASAAAAPGWGGEFARLCGRVAEDSQYGSGVSSGVLTALAWLDDPALTDLACPVPGDEFTARPFIRAGGSVYLIGADDAHNPLSPYFACFATYLWNTAKEMAADPREDHLPGPPGPVGHRGRRPRHHPGHRVPVRRAAAAAVRGARRPGTGGHHHRQDGLRRCHGGHRREGLQVGRPEGDVARQPR